MSFNTKVVLNGGVFIPDNICDIGYVTHIIGKTYIIHTQHETEDKLIKFIEDIKKENRDDIVVIG